jgi:hypothetical protein
MAAGSPRWWSMQVVWAQMRTALGACGIRPGREREHKAIRARVINRAWTGQERGCKWEGVDNMQAPTSTGCTDKKAWTACGR